MEDIDPSGSALRTCRLPVYGLHDGGKIRVCSHELAEMFRARSPAEILDRDLFDFIAPEGRDRTVSAILSSEQGFYNSFAKRVDGTAFPVQIGIVAVRFQDADARLFTLRDLSPVALVIDDEAAIARMTGSLIRRHGYQTIIYTSPRRVLADYYAGAASVIISDIVMPEVDGLELVQRIRQIDPDVPAIFMSGYTDRPFPHDAATAFVEKPFRIDAFEGALASLPDRARAPLT